MSVEQWIGELCLVIGIYFVVCSLWARNFLLYLLKIGGVAGVLGDRGADRFFRVLGVILIVGGLVKVAGVF